MQSLLGTVDPATDPHRRNPDVHYRLYLAQNARAKLAAEPVVVCVQDFDYPDYVAEWFLTPAAYSNEADAEVALHDFVATQLALAAARLVDAENLAAAYHSG
jgi:hypothetical protein